MSSKLAGLGIAISLGALALAVYAVSLERSAPSDLASRLDALEDRLDRIEPAVAAREHAGEDGPLLVGRAPEPEPAHPYRTEDGPMDAVSVTAVADGEPGTAVDGSETAEHIEALVEEAVEKKAAEMQIMANKKPSLDAFAKTLALTEAQRRAVEAEVLRGQREIYALLETPADDGTVFLDELVDVMATGIADPGSAKNRWMKLFGRLMSEEVPGRGDSYAALAEQAKDTVRDGFRREMTEQQYAAFETWQMDPTEIQEVDSSPWKDVERRVIERARDLGAEIPEDRK